MRAWNELRWTIAERHRGDVGGGGIRRLLPRRRNTRAVTIGSQPRHRAIRRADRRALVSSHGPRRQSYRRGPAVLRRSPTVTHRDRGRRKRRGRRSVAGAWAATHQFRRWFWPIRSRAELAQAAFDLS